MNTFKDECLSEHCWGLKGEIRLICFFWCRHYGFVLLTSLIYVNHKSLNRTASCFNHIQPLTTRINNRNVQYNLLFFILLYTQNKIWFSMCMFYWDMMMLRDAIVVLTMLKLACWISKLSALNKTIKRITHI